MDTHDILGYVLIFSGIFDVVVVPMILEKAWRAQGNEPARKRVVLHALRGAGWVMIVVGALLKLGVLRMPG